MAELISSSKGWIGAIEVDTYVPELGDDANIQDALKLFFFGSTNSGTTLGDHSVYQYLTSLSGLIDASSETFTAHSSASSDAHGIGSGAAVVGTTTTQTLSNKTLTSPVINSPSFNSGGLAPVGSIMQFAGSSAPSGWLLCDGTAVGRNTYSALFGVISSTYGSGDGSTTFNLPNLKGKVVVGLDISQTEFDALAETGGAKTHTHTTTSAITDGASTGNTTSGASTGNITGSPVDAAGTGITLSAVAGGAHDHATTDHSHSINPGATTSSSDSHSHTANSNASAVAKASSGNTSSTFSTINHTHSTNSDSHTHSTNIATFNSGGASTGNVTDSSGNHTHGISVHYHETVDHTHTTTDHTHTFSSTSDSGNSIQPYIVLNYIIKH